MTVNGPPIQTNAKRVLHLLEPILQIVKTTKAQTDINNTAPQHSQTQYHKPLVIGLTGLQGSGKSTWAAALVDVLEREHGLRVFTISLDDLYKTHGNLLALRDADPENKLLRTRGQPGTHDEMLAREFFERVIDTGKEDNARGKGERVRVPSFDKSLFEGEGDRAPESQWPRVELPVDVVVFEGWCLGFRPLDEIAIREKHALAVEKNRAVSTCGHGIDARSTNTLADHALEHLLAINANLCRYDTSFTGPEYFDVLIHLDTDDLANVYGWRLEQEHALKRRTGGKGMSDEEVVAFVRGYMPTYELYLDQLRGGFFVDSSGSNIEAGSRKRSEEMEKIQVKVSLDRGRDVVGYGIV